MGLKLSKEEVIQAITTSNTISEVCGKLYGHGSKRFSNLYRTVKIYDLGLLLLELKARRPKITVARKPKLLNEEIFVLGDFPSRVIRSRILKQGILPYVCSVPECGQLPFWLGKPLTLHLDHINGNNCDNRLENLRFLCIHCHSQTSTFCSGNRKESGRRQKFLCLNCNNVLTSTKPGLCVDCFQGFNTENKSFRVDPAGEVVSRSKIDLNKEELEKLLSQMPMTAIGKMFGVSDNAVKKRAKKLGIELKDMRGYWQKVAAGKISADMA